MTDSILIRAGHSVRAPSRSLRSAALVLPLLCALAACDAGDTSLTTAVPPASEFAVAGASNSINDRGPSSDYPVPGNIDPTGVRDVTGELLAFFATVPDGSRILFASNATYRIEGPLRIRDRHGLVFEGNGVRFIANDPRPPQYRGSGSNPWRNRYHWSIEGSSQITLRDMSVRGANAQGGQGGPAYVAALEAQHGVNVSGAENVRIENLDISYVHGDFVYVGAGLVDGVRQISRGIVVRGGEWSHNGRQGIAITNAEGVLVDGISMTETRRASIDLEPNTASAVIRNVVIRDSYFGPGRLLWLAAGGSSGTMENVRLERNRLDRTSSVHIRPPAGSRRSNFRLIGNVSTRPGGGGNRGQWNVWRVDGLVAHNNVAPVQPWRNQPGLWLHDVTGVDAPAGQWPGANPQIHVEP